jgi:ribonucleotide reductase beta subunit family protein with ferritin-like domain
MNKIEEAFNTLANIAGGIIHNGKFELLSSNKVVKSKLNHDLEKFYCLSVPETAFIIKVNDKISVTGNCHSEAGAWLFRTTLKEALDANEITHEQLLKLRKSLEKTARVVLEHETIIIEKIFEKGNIKGITSNQLIHFVESRLDICLTNLGFGAIFKPTYNPIAKWFYLDVDSAGVLHDFFANLGSSYTRNWTEGEFKW